MNDKSHLDVKQSSSFKITIRGKPNEASLSFLINATTVFDIDPFAAAESGQPVKRSTKTRMKRFVDFIVGRGPADSIQKTSKREKMGI